MRLLDSDQIKFSRIDDKIISIFDLSYYFFIAAVDLSAKGWNEESFSDLKRIFLDKMDNQIEDLNAQFTVCLEKISSKLDESDRKEYSLGI